MEKQQYRFFIITFSIDISVFFSYRTYPSKHTEVFEGEIQAHEILKSLCESVVVL